MSSDGGKAGRDTDVSGAEKVYSKEKGITTYADTKIQDRKDKDFIESGANKIEKTIKKGLPGGPAVNVAGNILSGPFQAGSIKTREFFMGKVLESTKAKKNIGYTKTEFQKLSLTKQNEVYGKYLSGRMDNKTDAYGNQIRSTGGDGGGQTQQKTTAQIEAENVAAQKAAQAEADQAAAEQADAYKKKRLSITSSRSLFAKSGGRGFFN